MTADEHIDQLERLLTRRREARGEAVAAQLHRDSLARDLAVAEAKLLSAQVLDREATAAILALAPPEQDGATVLRAGGHRVVGPPVPVDPDVKTARVAGYEGVPCPSCGERKVIRSGRQHVCDGCSARWEDEHGPDPIPDARSAVGTTTTMTSAPPFAPSMTSPSAVPDLRAKKTRKPREKKAPVESLPSHSPLVLPVYETTMGYEFRDPIDVTVAASAGLPASFGWGDFDRYKGMLHAATGRDLIVQPLPPRHADATTPAVAPCTSGDPDGAPCHFIIRCEADGWCRSENGTTWLSEGQIVPFCFGLAALPEELRKLADAGMMVDLLPEHDCDESVLLRIRELAIESGHRGVCVMPPEMEGQPSLPFEETQKGAT